MIGYWRTKSGFEVDFILDHGKIAIEVKGTRLLRSSDLRPMRAYIEEHTPRQSIIVCNEPLPRKSEGIDILPWRHFLDLLWSDKIM